MQKDAKNTRSHAGTATQVTSTDPSSRKHAGRESQLQNPLTAYRPRAMTRRLSGTCEDRAAAVWNCSRTQAARAFLPDVACARGIRELKTSNRHVVHGQLLVRISLHASFSCRWPALICGRSHPTRFASGAGSLYAIRSMERRVLPAGADSRSLAPHSLRERRRLFVRHSLHGTSRVAGGGLFSGS